MAEVERNHSSHFRHRAELSQRHPKTSQSFVDHFYSLFRVTQSRHSVEVEEAAKTSLSRDNRLNDVAAGRCVTTTTSCGPTSPSCRRRTSWPAAAKFRAARCCRGTVQA